jgi:hypothetical protein
LHHELPIALLDLERGNPLNLRAREECANCAAPAEELTEQQVHILRQPPHQTERTGGPRRELARPELSTPSLRRRHIPRPLHFARGSFFRLFL